MEYSSKIQLIYMDNEADKRPGEFGVHQQAIFALLPDAKEFGRMLESMHQKFSKEISVNCFRLVTNTGHG